jgi:glycerol-3-phosphate dehydrogenase (NAD(P)+)
LQVSERAAVLVTSKGLVPPLGTTPSAFVSERVHARATATLAVPAGPREILENGASGVVATRDAELRRQLRDVLRAGGLTVAETDDVTGVELAACAKTAAALATSAAAREGAGTARAAADRILSEVQALALASGARSETFRAAGTPAAGADSLATLPLLGLALERQGIDAPATTGLRRVLAGESTPDEWLDSLGAGRPTEPTPAG